MSPPHQCVFCDISQHNLASVRLYEDKHCFIILDKFPLQRGHLLIIPHHHEEFENKLPLDLKHHLLKMVTKTNEAVLKSTEVNCQATHVMLHNGKTSGQHIQHVHWHIIPRYKHDWLTVIGNLLFRFWNPFNHFKAPNETAMVNDLKRLLQ
jgi:histidine triad (HIT) family protein